MESMTALKQLDRPKELMNIINKLPYDMRKAWRKRALTLRENQADVTFKELLNFVRQQSKLVNQPIFGKIKDNLSYKRSTSEVKPQKRVLATNTDASTVSDNNFTSCLYCRKTNHDIKSCNFFKRINYDQRVEFVKKKSLCFSCLREGHTARGCLQREKCDICQKTHPTLLHRSWRNEDNRERPTTEADRAEETPDHHSRNFATISGNCKGNKILCPAAPVIIKVNGRSECITVYAALDTCSSSTFIDEKILEKLGVHGKQKSIPLRTMGSAGNTKISTKVINSLEIYNLQMELKDSIPVVYSQKNWPFSDDDVPKFSDIENTHLVDLPFTFINTSVSLLIGMDRPEILKPLQVVDGPLGDPYATLHNIGWVINGPVQRKQNLLMNKRKKNPNEKETLITNMYRSDYADSHYANKESSEDDKKFEEIIFNSLKLGYDKHYEADLPLKTTKALPNNKSQAYSSFITLQRRLQRNSELEESYKNFMNMMIQESYMDKIPPNESTNNAWFVTHHPVYHKRKGSLRIVFNCALKFQGISLNDVLYQGPDITNSLIGVLLRFRQEKIAFIGDITKMLYQVKVSKSCRDYLRLFWYDLDTNLPVQYRLTVHLFGATSSPAVAGVALRQTALDNPHYSSEARRTVERNFYVDDLLVSTK